MKQEQGEKMIGPDERTRDFFRQDYAELAHALTNRLVTLEGTDKRIQITQVEAWPREQVGKQYQSMETEMQPGDWWAFRIPVRRMQQSIIVATDQGERGACVRVIRAGRIDHETGQMILMPREGDIATFFELSENERLQLQLRENSEMLTLIRTGEIVLPKRGERIVNPSRANEELQTFLHED
jgi:hypothetical protein